MDIYDYAMMVEKEGEDVYRDLAKNAPNQELTKIFEWLANAEVKHYHIFARMKAGESFELEDSTILEDTVTVFEKIKLDQTQMKSLAADAYQKAKEIESKMSAFYLEKAEEVNDVAQKEILTKIADEEKRHEHVIENLIKFVTNPETWIKEEKFREILNAYSL